jgi:hypothetical protein
MFRFPSPSLTFADSTVKVVKLNADKLNGLDSTQFPSKRAIPFNRASGAISVLITRPPNELCLSWASPQYHIQRLWKRQVRAP